MIMHMLKLTNRLLLFSLCLKINGVKFNGTATVGSSTTLATTASKYLQIKIRA